MEQLRVYEHDLATQVDVADGQETNCTAELTKLWTHFSSSVGSSVDYTTTERILKTFFKTRGLRDSAIAIQSE